jgi:hypothetical protein
MRTYSPCFGLYLKNDTPSVLTTSPATARTNYKSGYQSGGDINSPLCEKLVTGVPLQYHKSDLASRTQARSIKFVISTQHPMRGLQYISIYLRFVVPCIITQWENNVQLDVTIYFILTNH